MFFKKEVSQKRVKEFMTHLSALDVEIDLLSATKLSIFPPNLNHALHLFLHDKTKISNSKNQIHLHLFVCAPRKHVRF